jgi:hypothetical protein
VRLQGGDGGREEEEGEGGEGGGGGMIFVEFRAKPSLPPSLPISLSLNKWHFHAKSPWETNIIHVFLTSQIFSFYTKKYSIKK